MQWGVGSFIGGLLQGERSSDHFSIGGRLTSISAVLSRYPQAASISNSHFGSTGASVSSSSCHRRKEVTMTKMTNSEEQNVKAIIGFFVVAITVIVLTVFMLPLYALQGWVVVNLWTWFVPAALTTWIPSVWQAFGLTLLVGVVRYKAPKDDDDKTTKEKLVTLGKTVMYEILGPLASLGIGAIVKFWIMKGM